MSPAVRRFVALGKSFQVNTEIFFSIRLLFLFSLTNQGHEKWLCLSKSVCVYVCVCRQRLKPHTYAWLREGSMRTQCIQVVRTCMCAHTLVEH